MHTDLPLNNSKDDKLGRFLFATEIANGLVNSFANTTDSIVLGINGSWGSGKSTLINFIINEVERISKEKNKEIISLRFNPWMFSGQKELQAIFLKELYRKLESKKEKLKSVSKKLSDLLDYLNWLKYIHSGAGEAVKDAKSILDKSNKDKGLLELKSELDKLLIESEVKLYITIDDIDRLTPSEITDIFQLVKLNGNFSNSVFILAYDQEVVTDALEKQFGSNGRKYIEKIVQVDYTLPNISREDISRIFVDSLNNLFDDQHLVLKLKQYTKNIKSEEFVKLFKSIRDVYRFNNSIKLRLPSIYKELNIKDFLLIESLRVFCPKAYQFILNSKDKLTARKKESRVGYGTRRDEITSVNQFINDSEFDLSTKSIIKSLFVFDSIYHDQYEVDRLFRDMNIANSNYFDRYFNLQLSDLDIQENVFTDFISSPDVEKKIKILENIDRKKMLFQFLNWIEIKSYHSEVENIELIIFSCFSYSDNLEYKKEIFNHIDSKFMTIQRFCSRIIDRVDKLEKRRQLIEKHISDKYKPLSFSSMFTANSILRAKQMLDKGELYSNYMWYYLFSQDKKDNELYEKSINKHYKKSIKKLMELEIKNEGTLNGDALIFILPELNRLHSKYYNSAFKEYIEDDKKLLHILTLCITRSYVTSGSIVGYQLAEYQLLPEMDKEKIKNRLEMINKSSLSKDQLATLNFFNQAYKDGFKKNKFYNFYTLEDIEW